ncbi:MAG TPA: FAD-dependent oxidoreductase [Alphaproteobacteria bacterium]|nr:FAD-dependent oxidoreductase [Alphaproteobacteria bacterium]
MEARPRILILGGGFGGLEAAFYVRHKAGDAVTLTLISDHDNFLFKPNTIYIPFGEDPETFKMPLSPAMQRKDIALIRAKVHAIHPDHKKVETDAGDVSYDKLVVATGAAMRPSEIPGLQEHALTLWTPEDMLKLREALQQTLAIARSGQRQRLLFLVPPNNKCSGPLYELVLMTDTWLRQQGARDHVDLIWTTVEEGYIQAFGPRLNTVVAEEFEERGIDGRKGYVVRAVEPKQVHYLNGESLDYDLLLTFPPYIAAVPFPSLPADDRGFVKVEPDSRRVSGTPDVYAVGDAADFPIKQAFLALLQADAAADHIVAELRGQSAALKFEPMSLCVMEELNKATFAQVPLKYTGDPMKPVVADADDTEHYKVGVSPLWRMGKKVLGLYVPWRFSRGEPFHAGFAWQAMDLGLKVMAKVLAK